MSVAPLDMREDRAALFRRHALEAESKAFAARNTEPTRRAWLILAREWTKMAEKAEVKAVAERSES